MIPLIFFDPLFTGGNELNVVFRHVFGASHVTSYPPEPVSRGRQVERAATALWFNGFAVLSANFHAARKALPYQPPLTTCTVLDHPLDRLYARYIHFSNFYLRFPDYNQGRRDLPEPLRTLAAFAAFSGHDNQLVRFFAEMENDVTVMPAHRDRAIEALERIDHVWFRDGMADGMARLGSPLDTPDAAAALAAAQAKAAAWHASIRSLQPGNEEAPAGEASSHRDGADQEREAPRLLVPGLLTDCLADINRHDLDLYAYAIRRERTI